MGLLNLLNCLFQGIVAVCAIVAIGVTKRQFSGKAKANLKMGIEFKFNEGPGGELVVELYIYIMNLGLGPVYISSCGIELWSGKKPKHQMRISGEPFVLKSGQCETVHARYRSDNINEDAQLRDRVKVYAIYQMDKIFYDKKDYAYDEFKHLYEKRKQIIENK